MSLPEVVPALAASDALLARWQQVTLPTYGVPKLALVRGEGATVWDADGRRYTDLLGGIAVNALGHAHPALIEAVTTQLATLGHTSNLYATEPAVRLAERLLDLLDAPAGRVFFANSGAEANEAALKLLRRHGRHLDPAGGRLEVVAAAEGFHGRTFGALAVTGSPGKRDPFLPLDAAVRFVPYGDVAALSAAVTERTAGVLLEPLLGEAGVVPPPAGYLAAARAACDRSGALLVLDEVQGGIGRSGTWFTHQHPAVGPVRPDVVTLAKGLGGGLPIGAAVALSPVAAAALRPGEHGSTFGGNPVCAAAALAVLGEIERAGLLATTVELGERLAAGVAALADPLITGVAGLGLWRAVLLRDPLAAAVELEARRAGFLVNAATPDRVRLAPPLVITAAQVDGFLAALPAVLDRAAGR